MCLCVVCVGGALSLAGEGVCLVGAVGMMKKELRDKLERSKCVHTHVYKYS